MIHDVSNFATAAASVKRRRSPRSAKVSPAQAIHRRGRTNQRVTPIERAGGAQRPAVHRRLLQGQSPRGRCASGAAWDCRTSCRRRSQSFAPRANRNARATVLSEAIEAPRPSRSPRKNAPSRSLFGNASNGSSGRDRTAPQPQTPRHRTGNPRKAFSSPRPVREAGSSRFFRFGAKEVAESGVQARCPRGAGGTRSTQTQQSLQRPARRGSRKTGRRQRVRVSRCRSSDRHQRRR